MHLQPVITASWPYGPAQTTSYGRRTFYLQWKIGPALAAGNTVVLKPSEVASITCLEFAEIAFRAGLPAGVLNVVTGTGSDAGAALRSSLNPKPLIPLLKPFVSAQH